MSFSIDTLKHGSMIFGTADGVDAVLTEGVAYTLGKAFAVWIGQKLNAAPEDCIIGVGYDARRSGKALQEAIMKGMLDAGIYVSGCDLTSTPAMFMSTIYQDTQYDGACMITGGIAPSQQNGIRFFARGSVVNESGLSEIMAIAKELESQVTPDALSAPLDRDSNRFTELNILSLYAANLCFALSDAIQTDSYYDDPLSDFHIIVDAGNGVGGFLAEDVLEAMEADLSGSCNLEPNGDFPAHLPDPADPVLCENMKLLVAERNADLGILLDGEGAQLTCILKNGTILNSSSIPAYLEVNDPAPAVSEDAETDPLELLKKVHYPQDGIHQLIRLIAYLVKTK